MTFTQARAKVTVARYYELLRQLGVDSDVESVRIAEDLRVEHYVNTSCHCHPEYNWKTVGNLETILAKNG